MQLNASCSRAGFSIYRTRVTSTAHFEAACRVSFCDRGCTLCGYTESLPRPRLRLCHGPPTSSFPLCKKTLSRCWGRSTLLGVEPGRKGRTSGDDSTRLPAVTSCPCYTFWFGFVAIVTGVGGLAGEPPPSPSCSFLHHPYMSRSGPNVTTTWNVGYISASRHLSVAWTYKTRRADTHTHSSLSGRLHCPLH
jgi:hypothetical protein